VLELHLAERLEHRRHVHAEAPAQPLLESIPALDGVLRGPPPRLDGAVGRGLLLVGGAERHPVAVLLEHRAEVVDAPQVVAELRLADLHDERGRIGRLVAPRLVVARPGRRLQRPRRGLGPSTLHLAHAVLPSNTSSLIRYGTYRQSRMRPTRSPSHSSAMT